MHTRKFGGSWNEDTEEADVLSSVGLKTLPKLDLSRGVKRESKIQSARSHTPCLRALQQTLASARRTPSATSARGTSSKSVNGRHGSMLASSRCCTKHNEMSQLPGGLLLSMQARNAPIESYLNPVHDDSSLESSTISPLCMSLGWPSPVANARLWRVERMARRKRVCQVAKDENSEEPEIKLAPVDPVGEKHVEHHGFFPDCNPPVVAFSRLRTMELAEIKNRRSNSKSVPPSEFCGTISTSNRESLPRCPSGLFSAETFSHYDVDHNGRLSVGELGALLRNHGMPVDYVGAGRAMELLVGADARSLNRDEFTKGVIRLVQKRRGSAGEASEVLQCVFRSYDVDKSGSLDMQKYTRLLSDLGHVPKTKEDWEDQSVLMSSCRKDGMPGPLDFQEFVTLMRKINSGRAIDRWCS